MGSFGPQLNHRLVLYGHRQCNEHLVVLSSFCFIECASTGQNLFFDFLMVEH